MHLLPLKCNLDLLKKGCPLWTLQYTSVSHNSVSSLETNIQTLSLRHLDLVSVVTCTSILPLSTDDAHNSGDRAKKYLFHFFGLQVNYSIYEFGDHRSCLKIVSPSHVKAKFSHKNQNRHSRGPSKLTYFLNL